MSSVVAWWQSATEDIYRAIPDFGGFVVKADSENRPGPFTYGRNHADGANLLARALKPHGGVVFWRCFVYDLSLIHISEPTRLGMISYAVFCLKKKKTHTNKHHNEKRRKQERRTTHKKKKK